MHHLMGMKARVSLSFVIKVAESGLQDLAEFHHKTEDLCLEAPNDCIVAANQCQGLALMKSKVALTSRPTSESSSKEFKLTDLDLTWTLPECPLEC